MEELLKYLKEQYEYFHTLSFTQRPVIQQQDARSKANAYLDAYSRLEEALKREATSRTVK